QQPSRPQRLPRLRLQQPSRPQRPPPPSLCTDASAPTAKRSHRIRKPAREQKLTAGSLLPSRTAVKSGTAMIRYSLISSTLVALVSVPGFLVGQKLRQGEPSSLALAAVMMMIVFVASAIMCQSSEPRR
ncbi:MAG: hypothetical protein JWN04_2856, partial [Myxococcaceae bacterium]|nr:hypothetical protein [Myxococcaceae bacterium]